ncbi:MAG TPA: PQQ-binding-like beta-propeller repeat protein, partial [Conexibacter sp.]|nr:PQQ-binding-like beta-propeller repeat protein [Conexibacter sp.]
MPFGSRRTAARRARRAWTLSIVVLVVLVGCGGEGSDETGPGAAAADASDRSPFPTRPAPAWEAPNGDTINQRWVDGPIDASSVSRLDVAWTVPLAGGYASTPVIADGILYTQDLQSNVHAIELETGRSVWTKVYEEADIGPNGVNVVDGRVFGATFTSAFALDARTGDELWRKRIALHTGDAVDMAPGYEDGTVYVSTSVQGPGAVGTLWALDAESGTTRWVWEQVPEDLWGHPEVNAGGG